MAEQYFIIGADGKEYGPVPFETLIQWIHERRVIGASRIRTESGSYMEAASAPELAAFFAPSSFAPGTSSYGSSGAATSGTSAGSMAMMPAAMPAELRAWSLIGEAWNLVKAHWLVLGGMFLIQQAIGYVLWHHVPHIGWLASLALQGGMLIGIWRAILGMIAGRPPALGMMFDGFDRFGDAFLACLVKWFLIILGLICLIVPGILLALMWAFTFPILAETRIGFWEAMSHSAKLTEGYRWQLFMLALAGIPVMLLGLICLWVGVFVSMAVMCTALGLAYRFIRDRKQPAAQAAAA